MPAVHGLTEQTYAVAQSHKTPSRLFIGHGDGVASMRWDGKTWIDEGRLPNVVYEARSLVEDADGTLWVSGADGKVLRVEVAPSGMRDSKVQVISHNEGLIEGSTDAEFVAGSIFATIDRSKNIFRWDPAAHKFVIDNRFLLPIDAPDVSTFLAPIDDGRSSDSKSFWSLTTSSDSRRAGIFTRQTDGTWHLEEEAYRILSRFRTVNQHPDLNGDMWLAGEKLIRFTQAKTLPSRFHSKR